MKTKLLFYFTVISLFFIHIVTAQTTFFNANFENGTGNNAWTSNSTGANGSEWLRAVDNTVNIGHNRNATLLGGGTGNATNSMYTRRHPNNYQSNTNIQAVSPVINFSGYENITLSVGIRSDITDTADDGFKIQYRFNGGAWNNIGNTAAGWYDQSISSLGSNGWTGGNQNAQWRNVSINISNEDINFNGNENVQFQVVFASDANANDVGVAFDNFRLIGFPATEIEVTGNSINIPDESSTTSLANFTDLGGVNLGGTITQTFQIRNRGLQNLTLGAFTFSGVNASEFTLITAPAASVIPNGTTTFTLQFAPTALGTRNAIVSFQNNDSNENPFNFAISGTGGESEISISGLGSNVPDNASAGNLTNGTQFPNTIVGNTNTRTFTIRNTGNAPLNLTGTPIVQISGSSVFTISTFPANPIPVGGSTTFTVTFTPTTADNFLALLTILNNDRDESVYDFVVQGNGTVIGTEINIKGNEETIADGDVTPTVIDLTDFGTTFSGIPISIPFQIYSVGTNTLNISSTTASAGQGFSVPNVSGNIPAGGVASFVVTFTPPLLPGIYTSTITVNNNSTINAGKPTYTFLVRAVVVAAPTLNNAPGGITPNLKLWLKSDKIIGSVADGGNISTWQDNTFGNTRDANAKIGKNPVFYNNVSKNVNFNPVTHFDGGSAMYAGQGFNNHDMFIVLKPTNPITSLTNAQDIFSGDDINTNQGSQDVTGFSMGSSSARYTNELVAYNQAANSEYGVAETNNSKSYSGVQIFNPRKANTTAASLMNIFNNGTALTVTNANSSTYKNILNSRYWLGRSEFFDASYNGDILEIITYDALNSDANRRRIESYLAIKYGITLGANGTSLDYVDSNGATIYNAGANFNFDIAGIGRDDASQLNQKQSKTENKTEDITIGLNSIFDTNSLNTNTFAGNRRFLIWGNDNGSLAAATPLVANISSGITPALSTDVEFTSVQRKWRIIETGGDVGTVKVSIPAVMLTATLAPPGDFYMLISNTPTFTAAAEYKVLTLNGDNLETTYDFNGTKYITFGYSPDKTFERSITFNGSSDFINSGNNVNLQNEFTVSAWIKREAVNGTIISKKNATTGYELFINNTGNLQMNWTNGTVTQTITSTVVIPNSKWHYVAVSFDGVTAKLYIDGVLNRSANLSSSEINNFDFLIGASNATTPTRFFRGAIDEVRVWDIEISEIQLRFLMNQEMDKHTDGNIRGAIIPQNITLNEVVSVSWNSLLVYYPMSTFSFTNMKDKSDNNVSGSLKNLTTVDRQTAPLPYESGADGNWTTAATWTNSAVNNIPNSIAISDGTTPIDWNIVRINNNVFTTGNKNVLGLVINATRSLAIQSDSKMEISHYFLVNGKLDLVGRSQLIQTLNSDLDTRSTGTLERDQQGTGNKFNYNYWSSPVSTVASTTANNRGYTINNAMKNGTNPATPSNITWVAGFDGSTAPFSIARRWLYKFTNLSPDYANWQQINENSTLATGQGFTMKGSGVAAAPAVSTQNYVFVGKPNNGLINSTGLNIGPGSTNLIGNPYPSALDANVFIADNASKIDGTLYFWEHYATNNTHILAGYQGGYATRTALGGVAPVAPAMISGAGSSTRIPGRFIPVGQAFFVKANATGGTINFNNNQRLFIKEDNASSNIMFRNGVSRTNTEETNKDDQFKESPFKLIRLGFTTVEANMKRQLLLGFTPNNEASAAYDNGYDGIVLDVQANDAYFPLDNRNLVIQAEGAFAENNIFPVTVKSSADGNGKFEVEELVNFDANQEIYLHDNVTDTYHNLRNGEVTIPLTAGETSNRFTIRFRNAALSTDTFETQTNTFYHFNNELILLQKLIEEEVKEVTMYNVIGQNVKTWNASEIDASASQVNLATKSFAKGVYIVNVSTAKGKYSKKIIVE